MKKKIVFAITTCLCLLTWTIQAQTIVSSLVELKPYLDDDNANVKLAPGTYNISASDITSGTLGSRVPMENGSEQYAVFLFEGNNSTYDFTGVTINVATEVLSAFGSVDTREIQIIGNNNVLLNLTIVDVGSVYDAPIKRATNIVMDGANNRIEGFHCTIKGSYPYGYGDIFGKGGGSVINHRKHSACLIRGNSNHVKNSTFIHRSYGHAIFFQAANDPKVEGCYVEGSTRTTDEVLAEEGTGSPADNVDFMTVWGYTLQPGWTFNLGEAGIRSYNAGETIIDGVEYSRGCSNPVVIDNTIVKMRVGVNVGWASGTKYLENNVALACEVGYWAGGNAQVINCSGDTSIGPLYSEDVYRSNSTIDLTVLDNYIPRDGNHPAVYLAGGSHNFTIKDGTTSFDDDLEIFVGGTRTAHRWNVNDGLTMDANSLSVTNETRYPIVLGSNASNNTILTCGPVTDNGSSNTITNSTTCDYNRPCNNRADNLQAECRDGDIGSIGEREIAGNTNEREVYGIDNGEGVSFNNIDLTGMIAVKASVSGTKNDVSLEVRQNSATGTLLATIPITSTGSDSTYQQFSADLNYAVTGETDLYFVAKTTSETGWLFNIDVINFIQDPCIKTTQYLYHPIEAENFCDASGVTTQDLSLYNKTVVEIENNDFIKFPNVNFGYNDTYNSIDIMASSATTGGTVEIRTDTTDGTLLATVSIESTGDWNQYNIFSANISGQITGIHDLYFVFKGTSGYLYNLDWFKFNEDIVAADNLALASNGGVATQSTTDHGGEAIRAIDGNTDGNYGGNSVTHTEHGSSGSNTLKWWQVDLGANKTISEIVIYGRTGGNSSGPYVNDLNNFTVEVLNASGNVTFSQFFANYPSTRPLSIDVGAVVGKIVRISKTSDRAISLAEVEVYGSHTLSHTDFSLNDIKFYPNPARNEITIINANLLTLEIYNVNGVLESKLQISENKKIISIENLKSGIHFLKFTSNQGTTVKKLIKL